MLISSRLTESCSIDDTHERASELSMLLRNVDVLLEGTPDDHKRSYNLLIENEIRYSENSEFLWRLAKSTRFMAAIQDKNGDKKGKEEYVFKAFSFAEKAINVNNNCANSHKWYAILCGEKGEFLGLKEKVANGQTFKKHIDIALEISPNDSTLHHLLGRFCYEVSNLI